MGISGSFALPILRTVSNSPLKMPLRVAAEVTRLKFHRKKKR